MERDRGTTLLGLGALSVLVAAATAALSRLFIPVRAPGLLAVGAIGTLLIAAALRRFPGIVAALVGELAVAWLVVALVARETLRYGLPTPSSARAIAGAIADAAAAGPTTVAPVPPTVPFLVAALLALGAAILAAHAALVRGRRPLLAVAPLLVLAAFTDLGLGARSPLVIALGLVAGSVAVVVADGLRRVREFAPTPGVSGPRAFAVATRGSRSTIVGVTLAALLAPPLLPGFGGEPLLDLRTGPRAVAVVDPFVSIRAQLELPQPQDLLQVRTDDPATYERLFALDRFDGTTWFASSPAFGPALASPADLPSSFGAADAPTVRQTVTVVGGIASGGWLPVPFPTARVAFGEGRIAEDTISGGILTSEPLERGTSYDVTAFRPAPRPDDLRRLDPRAAVADPTLTGLPDDLRPALERIAAEWAAGTSTPYDAVIAIQQRLLDGSFRYSLDVPEAGGRRAIIRFLTRTRVGFCQQFATAMAALVRALGYPARVAVGFREGERVGDHFVITNRDAHSWVEVPFPGYGWLAFEPTPGRPNPIGVDGSYLDPNEASSDAGAGGAAAGPDAPVGPQEQCVLPDGTLTSGRLCPPRPETSAPVPPAGRPEPIEPAGAPEPASPWPLVAAAALILLAARRRRLARAATPRERALVAYRNLEAVGSDLGARRERGETLAEFAARLVAEHPRLREDLVALVSVTDAAAYAAGGPDPADAERAVLAARSAAATLRDDAGWLRRAAGAYRVTV